LSPFRDAVRYVQRRFSMTIAICLHNHQQGRAITLIYDLDASDPWIKPDYGLGSGSGSNDMFAYINSALFTDPNQYVTDQALH
jgi:hypothetical protein